MVLSLTVLKFIDFWNPVKYGRFALLHSKGHVASVVDHVFGQTPSKTRCSLDRDPEETGDGENKDHWSRWDSCKSKRFHKNVTIESA